MLIMCKSVKNPDAALRAYYGTGFIDNAVIMKIFDTKSTTTVAKLKKLVQEEELKRGVPIVVPHHVNTKIAFEVWGIDVKELERNRKKLQELGLWKAGENK